MDGVRTPVKGLVNAGAEPVFAFYLEDQVDEKLTINGVNSAHYTEDFAYTNLESTKSCCRSHCWLQNRPNEVSLTRCCSSVSRKCRLLSAITRLISSESSSSDEIMPCSQSSREHWVQRFFAVGPISTLGLVGDSGRTVRSLSAASKPRITQRTARNTPSIQEEGEEHIFRVREFQFLLGKICVAHPVAHSFILLF